MRRKSKVQARVDRAKITEHAWGMTLAERRFTAQELADILNMPCNRHFRQVLNSLAQRGFLLVARPLCDDGHYRKYFYGKNNQLTFQEMRSAA